MAQPNDDSRYARATGIPIEYIADDEVDLKAFKSHLEAADKKREKK